ncbi:MAG: hypothetical protein ABJN42_31645 [Roseibium sp.]|uniref:hypothetical protein n=1 Tax=Roseibium sp. TaxID=1936156 RepID=UPI00329790B5
MMSTVLVLFLFALLLVILDFKIEYWRKGSEEILRVSMIAPNSGKRVKLLQHSVDEEEK